MNNKIDMKDALDNLLVERDQSGKLNRIVRYSVTFDVVTPESAEHGDFAETGFEVKDRAMLWSCEETPVDAAFELIQDKLGHVEASSSGPLTASDWFTQADVYVDFSDASETRRSIHFAGLTNAEMRSLEAKLKTAGLL
jgi:hypothetical protein